MATTDSTSKRTSDHETIRRWVAKRGGRPAIVRNGAGGVVLRVDFADPGTSLEEAAWDDFFRTFDENNLAFLYQDETADGRESRFCKFVERDT